MKDSTNLSFVIKILALVVLLLVGYSKEEIFSETESERSRFSPVDADNEALIYDSPLKGTSKHTNLVTLTTKNK